MNVAIVSVALTVEANAFAVTTRAAMEPNAPVVESATNVAMDARVVQRIFVTV